MSIFEILGVLAVSSGNLRSLLLKVGEVSPDLKPQADEWIALLDAAVSQDNLVELASMLPSEIANIASGKIDPKEHPSDFA